MSLGHQCGPPGPINFDALVWLTTATPPPNGREVGCVHIPPDSATYDAVIWPGKLPFLPLAVWIFVNTYIQKFYSSGR